MRRLWAIVAVAMAMVACSERPVGAVVADTPRSVWHTAESVEVRYDNSDTLALYDVGVVARQQTSDNRGAIPLQVVVTTPSGSTYGGEVILTPSGRNKGGSFVELSSEWIEGARFGEVGEYVFALAPVSDLKGVWNVGLQIQNSKLILSK